MGVLKVKTAPGVWSPIAQGFDPYHTQQSAYSAGGTVGIGASVSLVSLTTPVVPVGRMLLVTMSAQVRQTTASAFDLNFVGPGGTIVPHQFGAGSNATGQIVTHTMMVPSDGTAMTFRIDVSAWGAQPVVYSNRSNISVTVMPLASASAMGAIETFPFAHPGGSFTSTTAKVMASLTIPARTFKRLVIISGFELCSWTVAAGGQYDVSVWVAGVQQHFMRGTPGVTVTLPGHAIAVAAGATPLFEIKAQMVDAATRDMVNGFVQAVAYPTV